jgi:hypothetical protein
MKRPPTSYRRRKQRRRVALGLLALAIPVVLGGFAYWRDTRFPARSESVAGLPAVELRVQDGVSGSELRVIRRGLRLTSRYMGNALGRTVTGHVEARVARSNGCRPFQSVGEAIVGQAERGFLCIDTASPAWRWLMLKDRIAASASAGHEYVHVLQGELGCLRSPAKERFRWVLEGMADTIAWRALVEGDRITERRVAREIREDGAYDRNLEPLRRYETEGGRDPEYALWHLAVRRLLTGAVASRAAPARRPELSLRKFCDGIAARQPWRSAFARSFGLSVDRFYAAFEAARARGVRRFGRG